MRTKLTMGLSAAIISVNGAIALMSASPALAQSCAPVTFCGAPACLNGNHVAFCNAVKPAGCELVSAQCSTPICNSPFGGMPAPTITCTYS